MNFYIVSAISFSIFLPGVLAAIWFKKIGRVFYPFIFCLFIGCANEVLSFLLGWYHHSTFVNNNIYVLIEAMLLSWFFYEIKTIENKKVFIAITSSLVIAWMLENFVFRSIFVNGTYFRIYASMIIVLLSIQTFNGIVFTYKKSLYQNAVFILCICFLIYFAYKAMLQSFLIYGWTRDLNFLVKVYNIMLYINLGVNLLYTLAVLWMPRRAKYILPSL